MCSRQQVWYGLSEKRFIDAFQQEFVTGCAEMWSKWREHMEVLSPWWLAVPACVICVHCSKHVYERKFWIAITCKRGHTCTHEAMCIDHWNENMHVDWWNHNRTKRLNLVCPFLNCFGYYRQFFEHAWKHSLWLLKRVFAIFYLFWNKIWNKHRCAPLKVHLHIEHTWLLECRSSDAWEAIAQPVELLIN